MLRLTLRRFFSSTELYGNPLLQKSGLPKFTSITPAHVVPGITELLARTDKDFSEFESQLSHFDSEIAFTSLIDELEKIEFPISNAWGIVNHLLNVKNTPELRESYEAMQPKVLESAFRRSQSKVLYNAFVKLQKSDAWNNLDNIQKRIILKNIQDMRLLGVGLDEEQQKLFNSMNMEMSELSTRFSNNVIDSTKKTFFTLTNPQNVDGLPKSVLEMAAKKAKENGHEAATAENGPWVLTLDQHIFASAMKHLKDRDIRKELYLAYLARASSGNEDNSQLIERILQLRQNIANILGFQTYAELSVSEKMASKVENVYQLSDSLKERAYNGALREFDSLSEFAKQKGADTLAQWDITFWSERKKEELFGINEEELKPYFSLPHVLNGMFYLSKRLFGIEVLPTNNVDIWHEDVSFYNVYDQLSGEHLASFYLDPYARVGLKQSGAWMDVCLQKSKVLNNKPVAYINCNSAPPIGTTPALMTFSEAQTLFHEFGHALQHMLTKVNYSSVAGISKVEWDAVEIPSQFMENWLYDHKTIYNLSRHYITGNQLPIEIFEKLKQLRTYNSGLATLRQLFFSNLDMYLHHEYNPNSPTRQSPLEIQRQLAEKFSVLPPLPDDKTLCSFLHIFAGGYSAGYYSYKWAEVMSADCFAAFEEVGLENESQIENIGRRFRDTILSMGGGTHPSDVFIQFRGREPNSEALLRHSGLN